MTCAARAIGHEPADRGLEVAVEYRGRTASVTVRFDSHRCEWVVDHAPVGAPAALRRAAVEYAREETDGHGHRLIAPPSYSDDASGDADGE